MDRSDETPLSLTALPTPADLLRRIAAADGTPWFPSEYARESGIPRDALNDPLNDLRNAGLVIVLDWVKGKGQGYGLTPDGHRAVADPAALARALAVEPPPPPEDVPVAHPELPPVAAKGPGLTTFDRGELARQALFDPPPPAVTPVLILANLVWFAVGVVTAWQSGGAVWAYLRGWESGVLAKLGGVFGDALLQGEWWRLATACFVHAGGLHLLLNLYVLGVIGPVAEGLWGRWRFAVIYAWAGLAGSCLAMAVHPPTLVVGASGAVWGVMAAVVAWLALNREHLPPEVVLAWARTLGLVLAVNIVVSFAPRVSWEAHLGGAAVGFASAVLANVVRTGAVRRRVLWSAAAALGLIPAGCLLALAAHAEYGAAWQPLRERAVGRLTTPLRVEEGVVYTDAAVWAVGGKPPKGLAERVGRLRAAAEAAGPAARRVGGSGDLSARAAAYAEAAADLAAALEAAVAGPSPPPADVWGPIAEKKKLADRRWLELAKR